MKWKIIAITAFVLILPLLIKWYADSRDFGERLIFSRDKKPVVTKHVDEIFNTEVTKTEWKEGFWLGLLPGTDAISPKIILAVAPIGGILVVIGLFSVFMYYREKKRDRLVTR